MNETERIERIDRRADRKLNQPGEDRPATEVWDEAADEIDGETAEAREARLIAHATEHPLVNKPCDCDEDTGFRCYPEDGQCPCGCWKHHVHNTCGHIVQWG